MQLNLQKDNTVYRFHLFSEVTEITLGECVWSIAILLLALTSRVKYPFVTSIDDAVSDGDEA